MSAILINRAIAFHFFTLQENMNALWKTIHQLPSNPCSLKADILPMCLILLCDSYIYFCSYNEIIITGKLLFAKSVSVGATHELESLWSQRGPLVCKQSQLVTKWHMESLNADFIKQSSCLPLKNAAQAQAALDNPEMAESVFSIWESSGFSSEYEKDRLILIQLRNERNRTKEKSSKALMTQNRSARKHQPPSSQKQRVIVQQHHEIQTNLCSALTIPLSKSHQHSHFSTFHIGTICRWRAGWGNTNTYRGKPASCNTAAPHRP